MAFNGAGLFLVNTAGQPVVTGTTISSAVFNALTADLATGLSTCIAKDGQTTVTANIPMNSHKITGLSAGSANGDSIRWEQISSIATWASAPSSANLLAAMTDKTGTGLLAFATSPTFTTPSIGVASGTSLSVTGQFTSTVATGTAPLAVSSTTKVANLNADLLDGGDWASPGNIGTNAPGTAAFTTATTTGAIDVGGGTNISAKRSSFSGNSEPYAIAAKYVSSGGAVYFGATDGTSTPGFQISNNGGGNILMGTNAGNVTVAGTLAITGALSGVTALTMSGDISNTGGGGFSVTATSGNTATNGTINPVVTTNATAGGALAMILGNGVLGVYFGSGAPTVTAPKGSLYLRTDGSSTSTRAYINSSAVSPGSTWTALTTAA